MSYKAPLMGMLEIMMEDMETSEELRTHLEYDSVLNQALKDKRKIDNKQVERDEIGEYYLRGFTGGEVLDGYDGRLSKQGLYNRAQKIEENYQEAHKEVRDSIQERAEQYFFYDRPNMTGTMGIVRDKYLGKGYGTIYEEYMHKGGTAPEYDEQHESESVYFEYYPQLASGERPSDVDEDKYNAMLAGFYRYRKTSVDQSIILGDLESSLWLQPTNEYVLKRQKEVRKQILKIRDKFLQEQEEHPTNANILVYIEREMEVYGEVARSFYKQVLMDEGLGLTEDGEDVSFKLEPMGMSN